MSTNFIYVDYESTLEHWFKHVNEYKNVELSEDEFKKLLEYVIVEMDCYDEEGSGVEYWISTNVDSFLCSGEYLDREYFYNSIEKMYYLTDFREDLNRGKH